MEQSSCGPLFSSPCFCFVSAISAARDTISARMYVTSLAGYALINCKLCM